MENKDISNTDIWSSFLDNQIENTSKDISDLTSKNNNMIDIDDKTENIFPLNGMPNVIDRKSVV